MISTYCPVGIISVLDPNAHKRLRSEKEWMQLWSCSVERMVYSVAFVEYSQLDTKTARCQLETITKFTRVRFTLYTESELNFRERSISTPVDKNVVNGAL